MIETPQQFGPDASLVGMLTQPTNAEEPALAFLMFNAGVLPRIGPHRLNVKLARALAGAGETSLRFDLSGQGDSRGGGSGVDFRTQAVLDLRSAMDHLEQVHGIGRFALVGICSGAVNAFAAALADPRVCGLLMFDGTWYRTRWTIPARNWKRFRAVPWSVAATAVYRRLTRLFNPAKAPSASAPPGVFGGDRADPNPSRPEFVEALNSLVARRVATLFIYSGSVIDYYSYAGQFRDAFGREDFFGKVRCAFRPDIDHTFLALEVQRRMVELVLDWMLEVRQATVRP